VCVLKLPAHTTHLLQPLDVSVFKALKSVWDKGLATYQRQNRFRQLSKSELVDLLCSVWRDGLTERNIQSGFRKAGIFPVNRLSYPESTFVPHLLQAYKQQQREGLIPTYSPSSPVMPESGSDQIDAAPLTVHIGSPTVAATSVTSSFVSPPTPREEIKDVRSCYCYRVDAHLHAVVSNFRLLQLCLCHLH
jgi:hypothetical protein